MKLQKEPNLRVAARLFLPLCRPQGSRLDPAWELQCEQVRLTRYGEQERGPWTLVPKVKRVGPMGNIVKTNSNRKSQWDALVAQRPLPLLNSVLGVDPD